LSPSSPAPETPPVARRTWIIAGALIIVAIVGLAAYPFWGAKHRAASLVGGPFQLQGPDGRVVTEADMKGEPFLVYFGYTNCP
jgi:protein SCO1/2